WKEPAAATFGTVRVAIEARQFAEHLSPAPRLRTSRALSSQGPMDTDAQAKALRLRLYFSCSECRSEARQFAEHLSPAPRLRTSRALSSQGPMDTDAQAKALRLRLYFSCSEC